MKRFFTVSTLGLALVGSLLLPRPARAEVPEELQDDESFAASVIRAIDEVVALHGIEPVDAGWGERKTAFYGESAEDLINLIETGAEALAAAPGPLRYGGAAYEGYVAWMRHHYEECGGFTVTQAFYTAGLPLIGPPPECQPTS